jgi:haloalkane dehalogenase
MAVLRTPEARFDHLPGYSFEPHYLTVQHPRQGAVRLHYLDEGPKDAPVALLLHGEPTWSFLYRKVIPIITAAGFRAVAPDYPGFGRSDKLPDREDTTYGGIVAQVRSVVEQLDLRRAVLVGQDWGGPIGLRVLSEVPERFSAALISNTVLPNCEPPPRGVARWPGPIIERWVKLCTESTDLPVSQIVASTFVTPPDPVVLAAYDAPFPDASYKSAVLAITTRIPLAADFPGVAENKRAWEVLERWTKPFLTAFSDGDPVTKAWEPIFQARIPGAKGQPHTEIKRAGHFVQEEAGEELARILAGLMKSL